MAVRGLPPSDTNRTYTSEIRFYQHSSFAWLVREAQSEAVVEIGLPLRVSGSQDADEIPQVLDHRPDVVLGERGRWTTSLEFLLRAPSLGLDPADPSGDDSRIRSGLQRLPVAGESGVAVREGPQGVKGSESTIRGSRSRR